MQTTTIVGSGRTLVWAHDLATGGPLAGATVRRLDGSSSAGPTPTASCVAATPARLLTADLEADPRAGILVVRAADAEAATPRPGRTSFVPVDAWSAEVPFEDRFWRLLYTDRSLFRTTDTIEAWGLLRPRDGGATPGGGAPPRGGRLWDGRRRGRVLRRRAIVRAAVAPDARTGVFAASVPIAGLPIGDYELGLWIGEHPRRRHAPGGRRHPQAGLPARGRRPTAGWSWTATGCRHGHRPRSSTGRARRESRSSSRSGSSDEGEAVATRHDRRRRHRRRRRLARRASHGGQWGWQEVAARPAGPEEGRSRPRPRCSPSPAGWCSTGRRRSTGRGSAISGSLHAVDLERLEREQRAGFEDELRPQGAAVAGATVTATDRRAVAGQDPDRPGLRLHRQEGGRHVRVPGPRSKDLGTRRVTTDATAASSSRWRCRPPSTGTRSPCSPPTPTAGRTSLDLWAAGGRRWSRGARARAPSLNLEREGRGTARAAYAVGDADPGDRPRGDGAVMPTGGNHRYLFFTARPGPARGARPGSPTLHRHVHRGGRPEPHDRRRVVRRLERGVTSGTGAAARPSRSSRPGSTRPRARSASSSRPTRPAIGRARR